MHTFHLHCGPCTHCHLALLTSCHRDVVKLKLHTPILARASLLAVLYHIYSHSNHALCTAVYVELNNWGKPEQANHVCGRPVTSGGIAVCLYASLHTASPTLRSVDKSMDIMQIRIKYK